MWVDVTFKRELEDLKNALALKRRPVRNLGDLTKKMTEMPAFQEVKAELLAKEIDRKIRTKLHIDVKLDRREVSL